MTEVLIAQPDGQMLHYANQNDCISSCLSQLAQITQERDKLLHVYEAQALEKATALLAVEKMLAREVVFREALEPFARHADDWDGPTAFSLATDGQHIGGTHQLQVGHLRNARSALFFA